jgi:hypothetical protein
MDQPDLTTVYTYGCRAYPIRKEVLEGQEKVASKTKPRTHMGYLVGYGGSNIYRIWVAQKARLSPFATSSSRRTRCSIPRMNPFENTACESIENVDGATPAKAWASMWFCS